jgi:hypothetical protein
MHWNQNEIEILTSSQILCRLNLKYLHFVSLQGAFRHAGIDVNLTYFLISYIP